ncbi:MAG: fibronectin type III domain-containing protein, partial [Bacteroidia bacterium]|nr:fibronectin type III domain-containing protein [Bacteroidia bacterium]
PSGGTFSGLGVIGNAFYPGIAGIGTHTITYSATVDGCNYSTTRTVVVEPHYLTGLTTSSPTCETCANGAITVTVYGPYQPFQFGLNGGAFQNSPTFSGLLPGTYTVVVRDTNGCEQPVIAVLSAAQPCLPPSNITISNITSTSATISWTGVGGAIGYQVQYRLSTATFWTSTSVSTTSITLSNLQPNATYLVRVRSRCGATTYSRFSPALSFTTNQPPAACSAPTITLLTSVNSTSVLVSWTQTPGANLYNLQYRRIGTPFWTTMNVATTNALATGLTPGASYEFRVRARCETTTSAYSATQTLSLPPGRTAADDVQTRAMVYPNPNRGSFTLTFEAPEGPARVEVYDAAGRTAHTESFWATKGENVRVFELKLAAGLYLLRLQSPSGAFFAKLAVE